MSYEAIRKELILTRDPLCCKAAQIIANLAEENQNYKESYDAMYNDYRRVMNGLILQREEQVARERKRELDEGKEK